MSRVLFQETQSFRETRWIWMIVIPFSIILCVPLVYGLYWQLIQGEPWGDKPMSDNGLIITSFLTFALFGLVVWLVLSVKLDVKIDEDGVHYRFFPNKPQWKLIPVVEILSYEVRMHRNFLTTGGIGFHRNYFKKLQSMTIHGGIHIILYLKNKQKVVIGTRQPFELERAIKKILKESEIA